MNRFLINKFRVDPDRRRIQRGSDTIALEPKVIQVLVLLARHQGEVVSHQTLLDAIWTNTVVEASALQRCIAQLRKALDDDARRQAVIATYPKKGYSLVADVIWETEESGRSNGAGNASGLRPFTAIAAGMALVAVLFAFSANQATSPQGVPVAVPDGIDSPDITAQALAAAEQDDFPVYSPDGRFVVYPRYLEERKAYLWARDLAYGSDFLVTVEAGDLQHLAWSWDSSQLVFVDASCVDDGCNQPDCSTLKSVSVSQSETNILSEQKLTHCSPNRLLSPEWLGKKTLAVIELADDMAILAQYDTRTLERSVLFESREVIPYRLSYSRQTSTLTISAINAQGRKVLLFFNTRTGQMNRNDAAVITSEEDWYPSASPP